MTPGWSAKILSQASSLAHAPVYDVTLLVLLVLLPLALHHWALLRAIRTGNPAIVKAVAENGPHRRGGRGRPDSRSVHRHTLRSASGDPNRYRRGTSDAAGPTCSGR
jgi:hypothetical protein